MSDNPESEYHSADLIVRPLLGQVVNLGGDSVRLGPINMKVLVMLVSRPGVVVSRPEIFAQVWGDQIVSDDALTRCISDLRAGLKVLTKNKLIIQTIPKRGYQWVLEEPDELEGIIAPIRETESVSLQKVQTESQIPKPGFVEGMSKWLRVGLVSFILLFTLFAGLTWSIRYLTAVESGRIAVLPTLTVQTEMGEWGVLVSESINKQLYELDSIQVLAGSAVEAGRSKPFPYFYFEHGVRWVVESRIHKLGPQKRLTMSLVDARTALVVRTISLHIDDDPNSWDLAVAEFLTEVQALIDQK